MGISSVRNQFGGQCYKCGFWVEPGTGYFEKERGKKGWRVQHCYRTHNGGVTCEMVKKKFGKPVDDPVKTP